ncbi:MAG: hypothetical protein ACI8RN_003124, partial [Glaciecola sp.]
MKEIACLTIAIILAGLTACGGSSSSSDTLVEEVASEAESGGDTGDGGTTGGGTDSGDASTADVFCDYEDVTLNAQPSLNFTSESTWT